VRIGEQSKASGAGVSDRTYRHEDRIIAAVMSPALLVAFGSLLLGVGLSALLVRKTPRPAPRHGTGRRPA